MCKNVLENIFSVIPCLLSHPPIGNVDYLESTTLCNTKITIFNIDMGKGGKNSSHITEKLRKNAFSKHFCTGLWFAILVNEYRQEIQFKKVQKVRNINNIPMVGSRPLECRPYGRMRRTCRNVCAERTLHCLYDTSLVKKYMLKTPKIF